MKQNPIFQQFCRYVALNICGMIGLSCYILADTYFVAKAMGSNGLAALNFAIPAYTAMSATGLMLGVGGATRAALLRTREENKAASTIFPIVSIAGIFFSLLFLSIGIFAAVPTAKLLGANGDTLPLTITYLRILMLYAPAFLLNQILLAFVRNDGNPRLPTIAMLSGSLANVVLDYILMFTLRLGIAGAAIATGISPVLGILILLLHFLRKDRTLRLVRCRFQFREVCRSISLGISAWITEISSGIVLIIFNLIILRISGNIGVAAYGIVANIALVETSIYTGIGQGIQPMVSRAYGANRISDLHRICRCALTLSVMIAAILYAILWIWSDPVIALFNTERNADLIPLAKDGLRLYFWGFFFAGINIVLAAYLSASEHPADGFWISITRGGIAILPLVLLLSRLLSMTGVWLSFPCCEIVTLVALSLFFLRRSFRNMHTV